MIPRTRFVCTLFAVLAVTSFLLAADPNFAGTWALNLAKSQLGGTVYTFEKQASGTMHYNGGGFDADFDLTGKEYTMPSGVSVAGKELSPTSWELTFRMKGKPLSKSKVTLNGNSLMWVSDVTGPDGKTVQQTSTDTRISGGPGFIGKWKSGDLKGTATTMRITTDGTTGILVESLEAQSTCKASFDGKDYPVMMAGQASKFTNAFTKVSPTTLTVTTKMSGKEFATDVYTISADGKTLTDESTATATKEKTKSVFDRR
jgi:hypothetical protein